MRHAPSSQACGGAGPGSTAGSGSAAGAVSDEEEGMQRFLCFEVMDTGVGVSHKALESLFQDYVQVGGVGGQ